MQLPGITINTNNKIVINRLLPVPGEVLVQRGHRVDALQVIARTERPSRYRVIDVARQLAQPDVEMEQVLLKKEGEPVQANEAIAVGQGGVPFLRRAARAPVAGRIAAIGPGWVLLETEKATTELQAFINGFVTRIIPDRGAVLLSSGAMISATCGFGGEAYGPLKRLVGRNLETLQEEALNESVKDCILLGGRTVDEPLLRAAEAAQVRGIIVGSIDAALLKLEPPVKVRVVATEGFGQAPMSPYTFGILATLSDKEISIRGSTPGLFQPSGQETPPEPPIILASTHRGGPQAAAQIREVGQTEIKAGSRVRVTCGPLLGASGPIESIPPKPQQTESGLVAPGAYVTLYNIRHFVPWANLEQVN